MDKQKEYIIKIFIKKCTTLSNSQEHLDIFFKWCEDTYNVSEEYLLELKEKYTVKEYISGFIPVIDKYFTIEELKDIIEFYSKDIGKKLLSYNFLQDIGDVGINMDKEIEQKFSLGNNKSS